MWDDRGLAGSKCGVPWRPAQASCCTHRVAACGARLHHLYFASCPGAHLPDRLTWSRVRRLGRLEEIKYVLGAHRRPKSEQMMIRVGEGPAAADRHEARVRDLRKDHGRHPFHPIVDWALRADCVLEPVATS
jgi:hypothetical protein